MAIKILQIDLQNDITPQIGSYDNVGGVTPNNWREEGGVYSLGPTNRDGTTPYYWFTPTREVTDFDLCWEDYQDRNQTTPQYHLEIGDSAGNVVLSVYRQYGNYHIGPVNIGDPAYQTWHKILVEVRKASASSSTVTVYFNGKKVATDTSNILLTSAKIALLGHVPNIFYMQNAGQHLRYVTIYDRSYTSKGINLDGMMTITRELLSKLITKLSTVAFTGSYNDLSDKPTINTVNNGTLTIQQNGTTVDSFSANSSTNKTANIQCVDLTNNQTVAGNKNFSGTTNIQSLTINGVACGDILTHNASEFVHVKGSDDIIDSKTFISLYTQSSGPSLWMKNTSFTMGTAPTTNRYSGIWVQDNNGTDTAYIVHQANKNNSQNLKFSVSNTDGTTVYQNALTFQGRLDGTFNFYSDNPANLGTSTNKWKSFNGVNPGALSLPGSYVNIDTTNWVLDGTPNHFVPTSDGWLGIQAIDTVYDQMHYIFIGRTGGGSTYYQQNLALPVNALWDSKYHGCIFIPVVKNFNYDIRCICSTITATFYPCQGNV